LIKAANIAKFKLKIVGSGRDEERLKQMAGPTVEFLGNLTDEELKKTYLDAKAFLFASRDEEFGIAGVEAMGYGLPVIAYRSGGIPEYVIDGKNGYLFDELNEDSLIKKVNELTNLKTDEYINMRKSARKTAEGFSEGKFAQQILNFVKSKIHARTTRG
jgi:glycosyltransferase involved in cell wall biosynthesis